jgi:hypothetical protein
MEVEVHLEVERLTELFNRYVLPTMKTTKSKYKDINYIKKYIQNMCKGANLAFQNKDGELFLSNESCKKLDEMFINRILFYENKLELYSTDDITEMFNISSSHVASLSKEGILKTAAFINGKNFFYKKEANEIKQLLDGTYGIEDVGSLLLEKEKDINIERNMIRLYIKRKFSELNNPINKYDIRIRKEDITSLLDYILKNYKPRTKMENFKELFDGENLKYIDYSKINEYIDYKVLRGYYINKYSLKKSDGSGYEKVIKHILSVCKKQNITWFTNTRLDNIYVLKIDSNIYLDYYENVANMKASGKYYLNSEVQKMFSIKNTDNIAEYTGSIIIGQKKYLTKSKIDELFYIKTNTVALREIAERLKTDKKRIRRICDRLSIRYYNKKETPLGKDILIYKSDIEKIEKYIQDEAMLNNAENQYTKYKLLTKEYVPDKRIQKTLKAYEEFVIRRTNANEGDYLVNALVTVYSEKICRLVKEIKDYSDNEIIELFQSFEKSVAKRELSEFINYYRKRHETKFIRAFKVDVATNSEAKESYTVEQWRAFGYLLFERDNEYKSELIEKALLNRVFAMSWLYCSMHYICAWRASNIMQLLPIPSLEITIGLDEYQVIDAIRTGQFTKSMSQSLVNDVITKIKAFGIKASKSEEDNDNILKLVVEGRYVYTIGMLLALCEAHRRIAQKRKGKLQTKYLITERATRIEVQEMLFGEVYTKIFGKEGFTNIRATKSYENFVQLVSQEKGWGDGHYIATISRGHKENRKGFSKSTEVYLEYINKSNDVDRILCAYLEREPFGFVSYIATKIIKGEEFTGIGIEQQNNVIKDLVPAKPREVEAIVQGISENYNRVKNIILGLLAKDREELKDAVIKIFKGDAPSKMEHSQCLLKAIDKTACEFPQRRDCVGCDYLVFEMYFLLQFKSMFEELLKSIRYAKTEFDKRRYTNSLFNFYLPILKQAVETLGKDRVRAFINMDKIINDINALSEMKQLLLR